MAREHESGTDHGLFHDAFHNEQGEYQPHRAEFLKNAAPGVVAVLAANQLGGQAPEALQAVTYVVGAGIIAASALKHYIDDVRFNRAHPES